MPFGGGGGFENPRRGTQARHLTTNFPTIIPFFRCSKILGEAGKQGILQQMFQKF